MNVLSISGDIKTWVPTDSNSMNAAEACSMFHELSQFLAANFHLVLVFPLVAILASGLFHFVNPMRWPFHDGAYIGSCLSLAVAYGLLMAGYVGHGFGSMLLWPLFVPQNFVLLSMGAYAALRKIRSASYHAPSLWNFAIVAAVGHGWTTFVILGLLAKTHPPK